MSTTTKNILTFVVGAFVVLIVLRWIFHIVIGVILGLLPIVIVCGVLYGAYQIFGRKALGGGRNTLP